MKEWLFLIGAIVLETFATTMLKYSEQFTSAYHRNGSWLSAFVLLLEPCTAHAAHRHRLRHLECPWHRAYNANRHFRVQAGARPASLYRHRADYGRRYRNQPVLKNGSTLR